MNDELDEIVQALRAFFPRPLFNVGATEDYFWVKAAGSGRTARVDFERLAKPYSDDDIIEDMKSQLKEDE